MPLPLAPTRSPAYASALHSWLLAARDTVARHGVDPAPLLQDAGLDLSQARDPMGRFPAHQGLAFWQRAMQTVGEELLGMEVALHFMPLAFNELGYALMASDNLGQMYVRLARFAHIVTDAADIRFDTTAGGGELTLAGDPGLLDHVDDATRWSIFDYAMLTIVRGSRMLFGRDFMPLELRLQRARPREHAVFEKVLRCTPVYGCADNRLVLDTATLQRPLSYANLTVARASEAALERYHAQWAQDRGGSSLTDAVSALLQEWLPSGEPHQEDVAARLNMTLRTLQRRLSEQGTNYREVLNDTRHRLALQHLAGAQCSVSEIAFLLGFSEVSAFTRAFRRWTGCAPSTWRQQADRPPAIP
jgi:AraC-like DNA-binding protein